VIKNLSLTFTSLHSSGHNLLCASCNWDSSRNSNETLAKEMFSTILCCFCFPKRQWTNAYCDTNCHISLPVFFNVQRFWNNKTFLCYPCTALLCQNKYTMHRIIYNSKALLIALKTSDFVFYNHILMILCLCISYYFASQVVLKPIAHLHMCSASACIYFRFSILFITSGF
jgi:hypothetical protein